MSDITTEQIELHLAKIIPSSLGIKQSIDGIQDEESKVKTLKSMIALAVFQDENFIFKCLEENLIDFKNKAEEIEGYISKLLAPDALLGIKSNSIDGITDFSSIQKSILDISSNIENSGKYGGKLASGYIEEFLNTQIKPQISNYKKETVVPLIKKLFSKAYSSYSSFQESISGILDPIESYDEDSIKKIISEDVLQKIQTELVTLLVELTDNIPEEDQGSYIQETGVILIAIKNILDKVVSDPKNPIGVATSSVFKTGSTNEKAAFLTGQLNSEPANFLYKSPFKVFIDYRMAENNGTTSASTTKDGRFPLTPPDGSYYYNFSSVSSSEFLEIDIDGTVITITKSSLSITNTPTSLQLANAINSNTLLIGSVSTDGPTSYLHTASLNSNKSYISILSTSSTSFIEALGITPDKKYRGRSTVRVLNTGSVDPNTYLSSSNEYYIRIIGQGSFKVDSFSSNSITVDGDLTESLSNVSYIVTEKRFGTLVYPTSTLTTPISEQFPTGRTLSSLWKERTSGNYEVPYVDHGSSGSLISEVSLFGRMSNYVYESTTGVANYVKSSGTTGKTREPIYTSAYGNLGNRVSSSLSGVSIVGGTIGKPLPTTSSSSAVFLYLPSSKSSNGYILENVPHNPSDPNYTENDFVSSLGSFLKLGDYIEVSDSGSSYNPQNTSISNFEGATFRVKGFNSTYKPHSTGLPAVRVLPDYDFEDSSVYGTYENWDDTGFTGNTAFFNSANVAGFNTADYPHGELELDIIQIHKFLINSGNFNDLSIKTGDYLMVHPVGGSNTISTWNNSVGEKTNSNFFELVGKTGSRELTLNTGWVNSYLEYLDYSTYSFSTPFYDKDDKFYGLFTTGASTGISWQTRNPSTGHRFFIFKKGLIEYDAGGTTIFIDDSFYSFSDTSATFVEDGVKEGDLFSITSVGNTNPYSLSYSSNYLSSVNSSLTGVSLRTIGMVESENKIYVYGSSSTRTDGYGKSGFEYYASSVSYEIRDKDYRKIIHDDSASFITDGIVSGMYVHVYERGGTSVNYTLIVDEVLSETDLLLTSNVNSSSTSEMNLKYYISTNTEYSQKGNICSIVRLNIHEDYDFNSLNSGIEEDNYTLYYLDKNSSNSTLRSVNIYEIKSNGYIQIAPTSSTSVSNTYLPNFYNTPFCIIKNDATTSLFKQSTDLTTYPGFPESSEIQSEDRVLSLKILGGRSSDISGIGGINQYKDDTTIIKLADQVSTNVVVSDITDTPSSEEDTGKPTFSGSDTSLIFGLAAGETINRFYGTFDAEDENGTVVWNYGDSDEQRHTLNSIETGYAVLSQEVNTITEPDQSFTNISGRETKSVDYYSVIPPEYPNTGDEIVYGFFRSTIKSIVEARTRLHLSRSDLSEKKLCYEIADPYPLNEDISYDAYLVESGSDPRVFQVSALSIVDQDGLTSEKGFLTQDVGDATLTIYGPNSFSVKVDKATAKYKLRLKSEIDPIINAVNFSLDLGFFDTIDKFNSGQSISNLSSISQDDYLSIWGDTQVYNVTDPVTSSSFYVSPDMIAAQSDLIFVTWTGESDYYGQYLILKDLLSDLDFDQNISLLSRYLNEVIASYGADSETIYTYGSLLGTSQQAQVINESIVKTGGFTNVSNGDKITLVVYADSSHTTVETYIKTKVSNDEIILYESVSNSIVYLKVERNAVSYSIQILQSMQNNITEFIELASKFPSVSSNSAAITFDSLKELGFDNATKILKSGGVSALLDTSYEKFSSEGDLNSSIEELGSSLYTE